MKKRDFIQTASTQFLPPLNWDVDHAINYAERLWRRLNERGYGDSKPHDNASDGINYYARLSDGQRAAFDNFWIAFDHKHGKQRAARRWQQLNISDAQLGQVIEAAKATAAQRKNLPPGSTPIMAENWLTQLRFTDFDETATETQRRSKNARAQQLRELNSKLTHAKQMLAHCKESDQAAFWNTEIAHFEAQLAELEGAR